MKIDYVKMEVWTRKMVVPGDIEPPSEPAKDLSESIKWCPLKPGIRCAATIFLAAESHCIECPRLMQYDQLRVYDLLRGCPA